MQEGACLLPGQGTASWAVAVAADMLVAQVVVQLTCCMKASCWRMLMTQANLPLVALGRLQACCWAYEAAEVQQSLLGLHSLIGNCCLVHLHSKVYGSMLLLKQ